MASNALGLFHDPESALTAAGNLMKAGFDRPDVLSPIPLHGIDDVLGENKSIIKRFTFFGTILGAISGFALAAGTAAMYVHPTGGRPIITFPPFLIISYELTILFGIIATVIGFFISARLPAIRQRLYVPEVAVDKFGVAVTCADSDSFTRASTILNDAGAEEVRELTEGR